MLTLAFKEKSVMLFGTMLLHFFALIGIGLRAAAKLRSFRELISGFNYLTVADSIRSSHRRNRGKPGSHQRRNPFVLGEGRSAVRDLDYG